ncbi:hypothetical protein GCM10012284_27720 [Mangrovihabitans endophyticus]|uniref:Cell envelope-related transcriptional attenuator domain-containing protein n=2 Tax=Mangrovihabitans endophyticus TaxID=1751298 RepID=A0A8J3BZ59_9ACTN|nr:hypothetical protein GCM10012284_27720 [Mangrovihabitans endophyticus]
MWVAVGVVAVTLAGTGIAVALAARSESPAAAPGTPAPTAAAPSTSPAPPPGADIEGPLDLLLIGVDTRVNVPDWEPHADALMLLHVSADLRSGYLFSLPRDLRVDMPAYAKAGFGGGRHKITEAMSLGSRVPGSKRISVEQGYELLTTVVSDYTGIDEFQAGAILNFGGLSRLTDALGGVTMTIDQKVVSIHRQPDGSRRTLRPGGGGYLGPQATYLPGTRTLQGWQALDYARQRYTPGGDYTRQRHQRQLVKALLSKARDAGLATAPERLRPVIDALGDSLVYVGGRGPLEYAYALRDLDPRNLTLVGLPGDAVYHHGGYIGEELTSEGTGFLKALHDGRAEAYLSDHPALVNKD